MSRRHAYAGSCHCRNIAILLKSDSTPLELDLRTDACSFCVKHHALYVSDPSGEIHLRVHKTNLLERYRFATRTADFLICRVCGVFVAAYMPEPPLAVVNVNVLDDRASFLDNALQITQLDEESVEQRFARRKAKWTPVLSFVS